MSPVLAGEFLTTSLVAQRLKRLPEMPETRVQSLGWEDPLEKEMAIHSSTLAWRIPWREEPGRLQSMVLQRVGHDGATSLSLSPLGKPHIRGYVCVCMCVCLVTQSCLTVISQLVPTHLHSFIRTQMGSL